MSRPTQRSRRISKKSMLYLFCHLWSKLLKPDNLIYIYFLSVLIVFLLMPELFFCVLILRHSRVPGLFLIALTDKRTHAHNRIVKKLISRKQPNQSKPAPKHAHISVGEFSPTSAADSLFFGSFLFP